MRRRSSGVPRSGAIGRKLTLAMRRRGPRWIVGLHPYDDPGARLSARRLPDHRRAGRGGVAARSWRADAYFPDAEELRGSVRMTERRPAFVMVGGESWAAREQFFEAVPSRPALWWKPDRGPHARGCCSTRAVGHVAERVVRAGERGVADVLHGRRARARAARTAADASSTRTRARVTTAIPLARDGVRVTAIELDRDAVGCCGRELAGRLVARLRGRVEDALADALPADVVLINPPRAGVDARVTAALERACNRRAR